MNSTKHYLPILAVGFVFFLTTSLAAQNLTQAFTSGLALPSPCDGSRVEGQGPTKIDYHVNATGDGFHPTVHIQIQANSPDGSSISYRANFEGNGQFDAVIASGSYDVPFHSVWAGQQGAPNFTFDGTVHVFVRDGNLSGALIATELPYTLVCTN